MAPRIEADEHLLAGGIEDGGIRPARLESGDHRAILDVILEDIANIDVTIFVELGMEREAVERGQFRMDLDLRSIARSTFVTP